MSEPRCDRTELLVSACAHCRPEPAQAVLAPARGPVGDLDDLDFDSPRLPTTLAQHSNPCPCWCGERIEAGVDTIVKTEFGWVLEGHE